MSGILGQGDARRARIDAWVADPECMGGTVRPNCDVDVRLESISKVGVASARVRLYAITILLLWLMR